MIASKSFKRHLYNEQRQLAFFFLSILMLFMTKAVGQTYTYNPTKFGCNGGLWSNTFCWDKLNNTGPSGCINSVSSTPPVNPTAVGPNIPCEVNVIINDDVTLDQSVTFGGGFNKITVGNGAKLTITGDVSIASGESVNFETVLGGTIEILGKMTVNSSATFYVMGDNTGTLNANAIDFSNYGEIYVEKNAFFRVTEETKLTGQNVLLNIRGLYRTKSFTIMGKDATLDVNDTGILLVEEDFSLQGQGVVTVKGTSLVEVGGDLQTNSEGKGLIFAVEDTASFFICGNLFNPDTIPPALKEEISIDQNGCRILTVNFLYFGLSFDQKRRTVNIDFATLKEWANSHFEIERSDEGIDDFKKIGTIESFGWKNDPSSYAFSDFTLPLSGGISYYRIKQIDLENKITYSKVLSAHYPGVKSDHEEWRVYPNPSRGEKFRLGNLKKDFDPSVALKIRINHPLLGIKEINANSLFELNQKLEIFHQDFPKGLLILEIHQKNQVSFLKLLN